MAKATTKKNTIWSSGRRKTSIVRARIEAGNGTVMVNDQEFEQYFPNEFDRKKILEPFAEAGLSAEGFDVSILAQGGGKKAQVDASILAIARALVSHNEDVRKLLRKKGFLTRDPRMTERKKVNLHKARRAHQFSKR
jgi:small subunit ribosomal protein S9